MTPVTDSSTGLVTASSGGLVFLAAIWALVALSVFFHATRNGNRHALLWGIGALIFPIAFGVIYVARVWWNRGGKEYFRPR
jgi:heme/copper-type cytochrome/quinol oxidase subunit 4